MLGHMKPDKAKKTPSKPGLTIPMHQRAGWRPLEFAAMIGISRSEVWQQIKDGKIQTVDQDGIKIIPRSFAVKAGYFTE
jgi:hypothetical protein